MTLAHYHGSARLGLDGCVRANMINRVSTCCYLSALSHFWSYYLMARDVSRPEVELRRLRSPKRKLELSSNNHSSNFHRYCVCHSMGIPCPRQLPPHSISTRNWCSDARCPKAWFRPVYNRLRGTDEDGCVDSGSQAVAPILAARFSPSLSRNSKVFSQCSRFILQSHGKPKYCVSITATRRARVMTLVQVETARKEL